MRNLQAVQGGGGFYIYNTEKYYNVPTNSRRLADSDSNSGPHLYAIMHAYMHTLTRPFGK